MAASKADDVEVLSPSEQESNQTPIIRRDHAVPAESFHFKETAYEPSEDLQSDDLAELSYDDLLTGLKKQYEMTRGSFNRTKKDLEALCAFYDEFVGRYKNPGVSKNRGGVPTVEQAFQAIGWNYEAARKARQRARGALNRLLPAYAPPPKPTHLAKGDAVIIPDKRKGKVAGFHDSEVDVFFGNTDETISVPRDDVQKLKLIEKRLDDGDLVWCRDVGAQFIYGKGKLTRTTKKSSAERKLEAEKAKHAEIRKAEAARKQLDRIAEKNKLRQEREEKKRVSANAKTAAKKPPLREPEWMVKRVRDQEYGVFASGSDRPVMTGTKKEECEAERDRLKRKSAEGAA
jgi:hypothetical protein